MSEMIDKGTKLPLDFLSAVFLAVGFNQDHECDSDINSGFDSFS